MWAHFYAKAWLSTGLLSDPCMDVSFSSLTDTSLGTAYVVSRKCQQFFLLLGGRRTPFFNRSGSCSMLPLGFVNNNCISSNLEITLAMWLSLANEPMSYLSDWSIKIQFLADCHNSGTLWGRYHMIARMHSHRSISNVSWAMNYAN